MNFDVEEGRDHFLREDGQGLREGGRTQRNDRVQKNDRRQRNNRRRVDDRHQMYHHHSRRIAVFWVDLESKDENNDPSDAPDNKKGQDRIVDHELVNTHMEDRHAYLKKPDRG